MKAIQTWLGRGKGSASAAVCVERMAAFPSRLLGNQREIRVFLPPGYGGWQRYPLLLVHDGQDLDAWRMQPTLERLYAAQLLAPLIVVGVAAVDRLDEYGTAARSNVQGLGGLAAFDIGWQHANQFGAIGVFSGSFWWRSDDSSVEAKVASRIVHAMVRERGRRTGLRFWFEAGLYDETADRDGDGVIDAIQDTTELIEELVRCGHRRGHDLVYREVPGDHSPATWAEYLPEFLTWAFPARKVTGER